MLFPAFAGMTFLKLGGKRMNKFKSYRQEQIFLLPPSIDDFVPEGHLARVVDEIVEGLDTKEIEDKYNELGQKSYHPKIIIKLLFYGYATGTRSGRKIAVKCESDTAYMYLSQMYRPDFRTINDFRKDNLEIVNKYFVDIVRMCQKLGMVKVGAIFIDGSKLRANAASRRTKDKAGYEKWLGEIKQQIDDILKEADKIDRKEDKEYGVNKRGDELPKELSKREKLKEKVAEALAELKGEEEKVNLTDKDAKFMKERNGVIRTNYNCQIAVTEDQVIIGAEVTDVASDEPSLIPMIKQVEENTGEEVIKAVSDSGYSSLDNYEELEEEKTEGYIPDRNFVMEKEGKFKEGKKRFHRGNFKYNKDEDFYTCPEGKRLKFSRKKEEEDSNGKRREMFFYKGEGCKECPFIEACSNSKVRIIYRDRREDLIDKMRERLKSKEGSRIYSKRMCTVEPTYGNIKGNLGYRNFHLRMIGKVNGEFKLICIGHNIRKIHSFRQKLDLAA